MRNALSRRDQLRRALVANALANPLAVIVGAGVLAAGLLLAAPWLALLALACWLTLAALAFFDEREAERVGARLRARRRRPVAPAAALAGDLAERVRAAEHARRSLAGALPADELDALVAAIRVNAARAQTIRDFLAQDGAQQVRALDPSLRAAKRAAVGLLTRRLDTLLGEIDTAVATLQTAHAQAIAGDDGDDTLERRIVALRITALELDDAFTSVTTRTRLPGSFPIDGRGGLEDVEGKRADDAL